MYPTIAILEYSDNFSLTDEEWNDHDFQHFLFMVNQCIIWHNDIISFEKEWLDQNKNLKRMINVVALTSILDNSPIQEAMDKIATEYHQIEAKTMAAKNKVLESGISQNAKEFCDRTAYMIGANFYCGYNSARYNTMYE